MTSEPSEQYLRTDSLFKRVVLQLCRLVGLAICLVSTISFILAHEHWIADLFCNFRVQYVLVLTALAVLAACVRQRLFVMVFMLFAILNFLPLYRYIPFPASRAESDHSVRVMVANVKTSNANHKAILDVINNSNPDVVAVLELSPKLASYLQKNASSFPNQYLEPRNHNFGIGIISRFPLKNVEVLESGPTPKIPSYSFGFGLGETICQLIATHPLPPMKGELAAKRNKQLNEMADTLDRQADRLLIGDFNVTPWSPFFHRLLEDAELRDASKGFGLTPTWSIFPTYLGGLKIDHILVSENFATRSFEVVEIPGSDHNAIVAELFLME